MPAANAAAAGGRGDYPQSLSLSLLAFHRTIGPIRKQSDAKYGKFADLNTVLEAVTPALLEQGLVLTQVLDRVDDDQQLLVTRLEHAPTGEALSSTCPIPTFDQLLQRHHELRQAALSTFPLDLQLAAIGALPPVLQPRTTAPQVAPQAAGATQAAELPPPPPRQPGLRLDDQLKGLYTLLGQLGTTTNPLHALGGTITYLRRYQILAILSLAPTDDDGQALGGSHADQRPQPPTQQPAEPPANSRTRTRRTAAPKPQPTPPPPAAGNADQPQAPQQPAAEPQPQQPAPEQPAAPPQAAEPADQSTPPPQPPAAQGNGSGDQALTPAEVQQLIALIRTLPTESIPSLVGAFRQQFQLPAAALVSDYIKTHAHAVFIRQQVDALKPAEAAAI
jgi:hypothetical protein